MAKKWMIISYIIVLIFSAACNDTPLIDCGTGTIGPIGGRVYGFDGRLAANAVVVVRSVTDRELLCQPTPTLAAPVQTTTNAQGEFELRDGSGNLMVTSISDVLEVTITIGGCLHSVRVYSAVGMSQNSPFSSQCGELSIQECSLRNRNLHEVCVAGS
jgi:hypothetical protein